MSLWFDIKVNLSTVGGIELVRINPINTRPADGEVCTYSLKYFGRGNSLEFWDTIQHPYVPENPLPLIQSALEKINGIQA